MKVYHCQPISVDYWQGDQPPVGKSGGQVVQRVSKDESNVKMDRGVTKIPNVGDSLCKPFFELYPLVLLEQQRKVQVNFKMH